MDKLSFLVIVREKDSAAEFSREEESEALTTMQLRAGRTSYPYRGTNATCNGYM